jgi:hypothetical protein
MSQALIREGKLDGQKDDDEDRPDNKENNIGYKDTIHVH